MPAILKWSDKKNEKQNKTTITTTKKKKQGKFEYFGAKKPVDSDEITQVFCGIASVDKVVWYNAT